MRPSSPSVRLEAHRLKWFRSGRRGSLIPFHELTEHERQFLIDELTKDTAARRLVISDPTSEAEFDRLLLDVLNEWGIMCPHPHTSITETSFGYRCSTCDCNVITFKRRALSDKIEL